jgi:CBS domain-containing protein
MAALEGLDRVPEELRRAIVTPQGRLEEGPDMPPPSSRRGRAPVYSIPTSPGGSVRIAHVLAGDHGVEDVEIQVTCPRCENELVMNVADEEALQTAVSLLGGPAGARASRPDVSEDSGARAIEGIGLHREMLAMLSGACIADAMQHATSISNGTSLGTASEVFADSRAVALVVVDENERPIGLITPARLFEAARRLTGADPEGGGIDDVMESQVYSLRVDAPLSRVVKQFATGDVFEIAAVSDDGKLAGLVTPLDLVRFLAAR